MSFWVLAVMPNPFLPQRCNVVYKEEQYNFVMGHFIYQVYSLFCIATFKLLAYFYAGYYCYDVHGRMGALQE